MDEKHRKRIIMNLKKLSSIVNMDGLYKLLIDEKIIFPNDVARVKVDPRWVTQEEKALEFFLQYTKRGPDAFSTLIKALEKNGNSDEANILMKDDVLDSEVADKGAFAHHGTSGNLSRPQSATLLPQSSPVSVRERSSSTGRLLGPLNRRRAVTMETLPPLNIKLQLRNATLYNMGVHDAYPMMSNPRGHALIINNINFIGNPTADRPGAEKDTTNLKLLFESLHFKVTSYQNVKKKDLFSPSDGIISSFLSKFGNEDCCIVAIMSHGSEGYFLTSDSEHVSVWKELLPNFNNRHCPKLRDRPKIFIIQSCRGDIRDKGVRRTQTQTDTTRYDSRAYTPPRETEHSSEENNDGEDNNETVEHDRIPSFEDMIICQSTVPGFVSNRDIEKGTWYIESFCRVVSCYAHEMELTKMLKKVGLLMRSISSEYGEKQMCSYLDAGFHCELYFNPGLFESDLCEYDKDDTKKDLSFLTPRET